MFGFVFAIVHGCGQGGMTSCGDLWRLLFCLPIFYFVWLFLFIYLKHEEIATYTWYSFSNHVRVNHVRYVAFTPIWIILGGALFGVGIGGFFAMSEFYGTEKMIVHPYLRCGVSALD